MNVTGYRAVLLQRGGRDLYDCRRILMLIKSPEKTATALFLSCLRNLTSVRSYEHILNLKHLRRSCLK